MIRSSGTLGWLLLVVAIMAIMVLAWPVRPKAADMLDANGNLAALMTGFCPKTNHFGRCKVKPHIILRKVKPLLWDRRENQPGQVTVNASVV